MNALLPTSARRIQPATRFTATMLIAVALGARTHVAAQPNHPRLVAQVGHGSHLNAIAFSPDGRMVLTGADDDMAILWEVATGKEIRRFELHSDDVTSVSFSPDGRAALTGSHDRTARMWDVATGNELRRFEGHSSYVVSVVFSPDGRTVLTGSWDSTARLWEVSSGKELRRFEGHTDFVTSVCFSTDGRTVLTGGYDRTARLWDVVSGKQLRGFEGHESEVDSVAFSGDGRSILTGSRDNTARLWDAATGKELLILNENSRYVSLSPDGRTALTGGNQSVQLWDVGTGNLLRRFRGHSSYVTAVAFSPDGKTVLTGSHDHTARLWDLTTAEEVRRFQGQSVKVPSVSLSPDGRAALTAGSDGSARLWDLATGKAIRRFEGHSDVILSIKFSRDGQNALTGSGDKTARLWDVVTGKEVRRFEGHSGWINAVAFSPDSQFILTGSWDKTARLWHVATGGEMCRFEKHSGVINSVAFSPDGRKALTGSSDGTARLWDVALGHESRRLEDPISIQNMVDTVTLSPDGRTALTGGSDGTVRLWDVVTGKEVRRFEGHSDRVIAASISPDGRTALTGSFDKTARLWDVATGQELRRLGGHCGPICSVSFSDDGRSAITGSTDATARLWDVPTGQEHCSLICFKNGSWAVTDSEGRFDASDPDTIGGLHWVVGNESIDLAQLKDRYYEPGLLAKVMGFNKEPLRNVETFADPKLHPSVKLAAPTKDNPSLGITLTNRGGGIGRVVVKVNGKELIADARGPQPDAEAAQLALSIDLKNNPLVVPGKSNKIEVFAYNAEGYLSSRGADVDYIAPGIDDVDPPHLWAIVAGISDYRGDKIDLKFAAKDAEDFAAALSVGGKGLFGADRIHLTLLSTMQKEASSQPTRANLLGAFDAAKHAKPTDVLVIYLAGHGVNHGGQDGDFYYLTSDAQAADLTDPAIRAEATLSSAELTELVKLIPASERQVLILDTCAAGRFVDKLTEKRDIPGSQVRALERVKSRTGIHVLAGCAADSVSYEASRYGQGLLTYSLLLGMRGAALRENEYVDVVSWFGYAADRVPELASDIGGIQRPVISSPKGSSFDIGRVTSEDRASIPLQTVRPLVLRSNFQNDDTFDDDLMLAVHVDAALRDAESRGGESSLVYVDAASLPDAYRIAGRYRRAGGKVTVEVRLLGGEKPIQFSVTDAEANLEELAKKIAEEAVKAIGS